MVLNANGKENFYWKLKDKNILEKSFWLFSNQTGIKVHPNPWLN